MFNYTACRYPLWRVLLAPSITIAVALLIELATVRQGLAQDACGPSSECKSLKDVPLCRIKHYESRPMREQDANHSGPIPRSEQLSWALDGYNNSRASNAPRISEAEVKRLKINQPFVTARKLPGSHTPENSLICACDGDLVCFPICSNGGFDGQIDQRQGYYYKCNKTSGKWERHEGHSYHMRRLHRHLRHLQHLHGHRAH